MGFARAALALVLRGHLSILIFHRVLQRPDPLMPGEPDVATLDALFAHLRTVFNVLPLREAVPRLANGTLPARALSITFDDGYADNLTRGAPLLRKHGLTATVFVATGFMDGGCMFNDRVIEAVRHATTPRIDLRALGLDAYELGTNAQRSAAIDAVLQHLKPLAAPERSARVHELERIVGVAAPRGMMLDRASVRALAREGVDIGAHTVHHPILSASPPTLAWREISESRRELESVVGQPITLFAYPNGRPEQDYTSEHVAMAREAGFVAAVSTAWGAADRATDRYQLPRFTPWHRRPLLFDLLMARNVRQAPRVVAMAPHAP